MPIYTLRYQFGLTPFIKQMSSVQLDPNLPSPLQTLALNEWPANAPKVWVKRDDLIHPIISGNKWRKLRHVQWHKYQHIVSIGGAYSNHLHALGYLCYAKNIRFTALVRGHYEHALSATLHDLKDWGSELVFIDKKHYAKRETAEFKRWLEQNYANALYIPEGGSTLDALKGVGDIHQELQSQSAQSISHIIAPVASGATLGGLILARPSERQKIMGIAVLKGQSYLQQQVTRFVGEQQANWHINHDYTHGGYAKSSPELEHFIQVFMANTGIPIETVYSAKLFFALHQMIMRQDFANTDHILAIHTGGLQGSR